MKWSLEKEGGGGGGIQVTCDVLRAGEVKDMPGHSDLSFLPPVGGECLQERGFKSCAPVKAAIIITLRGWTVAA